MRYGPLRLMAGFALLAAALGGAPDKAAAQAGFRPSLSPWEGVYLGVHAGYGWGNNDVVEDPANPFPYNGAGNSWSFDTAGALGGIHAGLNWESYGLVMGLETSFGYLAVEGDAPDPASAGLDTVAMQGDGTYADITARIGFAPGNMLYYMEAGAAFADLDWSVEDDCNTGACGGTTINAGNDGIESGWTAGVGIAYAFSQHASLRLEYAYYDLGEIAVTGTSGVNTYGWTQDVTLHTVAAGLSFLF